MPEPRIFLSYHRAELAAAERVRAHLLSRRCTVWMDRYDIPAGAYWPDEIDSALASADVVLGLLSPDAVASRNVKNEWDWAIQNDKRLLLLQIQPCVVPHRYVSISFIEAAASELEQGLERVVEQLDLAPREPALPVPQTRYARSGGLGVAFQSFGAGPVDLVQAPGFVTHVEHAWTWPSFAACLRGLGTLARVHVFDKRGTGLSDRTAGVPPLEERMDDIRAVMDASEVDRAVILGVSEGVPLAILFAATYPERTAGLILYGGFASAVRQPDHPWKPIREEALRQIERTEETLFAEWGTPAQARAVAKIFAPSMSGDEAFITWLAEHLRLGCSPGAALSLDRMNLDVDVRALLPAIQAPTLVLHRTDDRDSLIADNVYLAEHIPGAVRVEVEGQDHLPFIGDQAPILDAIAAFIASLHATGAPSPAHPDPA